MNKPYKCVVVTPAGRKRYMEVLLSYILREKEFIDEYRIWMNTHNNEDIQYFQYLHNKYPNFISLDYSADSDPAKGNGGWAIHNFFKNTIDPNTVYIRLDDDIVWLEKNFIKNLYHFRVSNPQYFLVYANIINNAIIDHIHQRLGVLPQKPIIGYGCMDHNGWWEPTIAEIKHKIFLDNIKNNTINKYKFSQWVLNIHERVSINAISWLGAEFAKFDGIVGRDEEHWLSVEKPTLLKKYNIVYGYALCSHFAFFTQRQYLDGTTDILEEYKNLVNYEL